MRIHKFQLNLISLLFVFFAIAIAINLICSVSLKHTSGDFDVYYITWQNYLSRAPIYIAHSGIEEFKYSPLFALIFSPLAMVNKVSALYIWSILNIISLYLIFYLFYKLSLFSFTRVKDFLVFFCLFALTVRYIFANIKIGQVNFLLCLLMVLTMYFEIRKKDFWAAFFLALSVMIKFFPLLFLIYFILRRRFKIVGFTILLVGIFLILPGIFSGFSLNLRYIQEWFNLLKYTPAHMLYSVKNYSLLSFFSWFFIARHEPYSIFEYTMITKGITPVVYHFWAVTCFSLFSFCFLDIFFRKDRDINTICLDYGCLFVCGLLFNPFSYLNALVFLIVPYFFILRSLFYTKLNRNWIIVIGALILLCFISTISYSKIYFKDVQSFYRFLEYRSLMWTMILVYFILCLLKLPSWAAFRNRKGSSA
ncbi:MAG: glycosyltransferase family 87 protein [Candidatus Omnitrophica bacterium]|nr:glycosyltransferase family 87 protein [Candidatus Omnitrophota bacterium]